MTNDKEVRFTLRMPERVSKKIGILAKSIGVSKNAYILMILSEVTETKLDKVKPLV